MGPTSSTATAAARKPAKAIHPAALLASVAAAVFVLYLDTAWFGFVLDDIYQVLDTAAIHSWHNFFGYFTGATFATPYYRPLLLTWFRLNDAIFGQNPAGWHLTSVAAHVAVTALVYSMARRLGASTAASLVAALIFGVHPIHIEAAAWVSDACDLMCAAFLMLAFLAYLNGQQRSSLRWKLAAAAGFLLALLAKESAVAFPLVVAVHAFIYAGGEKKPAQESAGARFPDRLRAALIASVPFFAITGVYVYWHHVVTGSLEFSHSKLSFTTALLTIPWVITFYLQKLVVPVGLSAFYDNVYVTSLASPRFLVPLAVLAVVAGLLWLWMRKSRGWRLIAFAISWFIVTLAPTLDLRQLPYNEAAHDRYVYLPSVAFAILVGIALEQLLGEKKPTWTLAAVAICLAVVLGALNVAQQFYYANDLLIHRRGVAIAPHNDRARNNLGRVLAERGEFTTAEAIFLDLLRRSPDSRITHYNLGYTYYREGRYSEAENHLQRAVALDPREPFGHLYLGLSAMRQGRLDMAEREVGLAARLGTGYSGFHLALSYVLEMTGDLRGALRETQTELAYSPNNAAVRERAIALRAKAAELKQ